MPQTTRDENGAATQDFTKVHMILIMGVTGSGKSHFVNTLVHGSVKESTSLRSETQRCQLVPAKIGEETQVAIVDTPGLDDSKRSDAEILIEITEFLTTQHQLGISLKGIIYLHRITDMKMQGSALRNFQLFQEIVGTKALGNVILGTTMWDRLPSETEGYERDMELRKDYWRIMESQGSVILRVDGSKGAAEGMIRRLMRKESITLKIQEEMFYQGKSLGQTSAAQVIAPGRYGRTESLEFKITEAECFDDTKLRDKLLQERERRKERQNYDEDAFEKLKKAKVAEETQEKINKEMKQRREKWKDAIAIFAAVAGLAVNVVVNLLPMLGVSI